jgi:hypothetical protein
MDLNETEAGLAPDQLATLPGYSRTNPQFFADPMIDRLFDVVLNLAGEVWSLRDRQMITEHLLAEHGQVTPESIERFSPDARFLAEAERLRQKYIRGVFGALVPNLPSSGDGEQFKWLTRRGAASPEVR